MGKRRRERDRPKAGPQAAYNPNKRVLLSYASDDEEVDQQDVTQGALDASVATGYPGAVDAVTADYQIPAYPDSDEEEVAGEEVGELETGADGALGLREGKVQGPLRDDEEMHASSRGQGKGKTSNRSHGHAQRDLPTGQRPALGGGWADEEDGEEGEYDEETIQAMAYLESVRNERDALPTFVAAPPESEFDALYDSGQGDGRGHISGDAYIGRSVEEAAPADRTGGFTEPDIAYSQSLKERFCRQREQMRMEPEGRFMAALDDKHPTTFDGSNRAHTQWQTLMRSTVPLPMQVRTFTQTTVRGLLAIFQRFFLVLCSDISITTSIWLWSLLSRLDDVGTMTNDEVFELREFAKRAILVQLSLDDPEAARQLEAMQNADAGGPVSPPDNVAQSADSSDPTTSTSAQHDADGKGADSPARQNTLVTLDMIIVVIGEVFGQRDLLDFRRTWTSDEGVKV